MGKQDEIPKESEPTHAENDEEWSRGEGKEDEEEVADEPRDNKEETHGNTSGLQMTKGSEIITGNMAEEDKKWKERTGGDDK